MLLPCVAEQDHSRSAACAKINVGGPRAVNNLCDVLGG